MRLFEVEGFCRRYNGLRERKKGVGNGEKGYEKAERRN